MILTMTGALCGDEQFGVQPDISNGFAEHAYLGISRYRKQFSLGFARWFRNLASDY